MSSFKIERENFRMPCRGLVGKKLFTLQRLFESVGCYLRFIIWFFAVSLLWACLQGGKWSDQLEKHFLILINLTGNLNSLTVLLQFEFLPKLKNFASLITKSSPEPLDTIFSLHAGLTLNLEKFKCLGDGVKAYFTTIIVLLKVPQHT